MKDATALRLLTEALRRARVATTVCRFSDLSRTVASGEGEMLFGGTPTLPPLPPPVRGTLYRLRDSYGLSHLYLLLSEEEGTALLVGPYLRQAHVPGSLFLPREGIGKKQLLHMEEYYAGLTVMEDGCHLLIIIEAFCGLLCGEQAVSYVEVGRELLAPSPVTGGSAEAGLDGVLVDMRALERRYAFENELITAVRQGQLHKEKELLHHLGSSFFEARTPDRLRNVKNYCIIMNTLLRKAAEEGGVHPLHIDRVSSEFAKRIEGLTGADGTAELMREIFRGYCRLVRKHAVQAYSPIVQRTVLLIEADYTAELTLSTLARAGGVSPPYLSAVFRRETGQTVSAYVRSRRMAYARHLLSTTALQIQAVALRCGIPDVQYFSKQFCRESGRTPMAYREEVYRRREGKDK